MADREIFPLRLLYKYQHTTWTRAAAQPLESFWGLSLSQQQLWYLSWLCPAQNHSPSAAAQQPSHQGSIRRMQGPLRAA